MREGPYVDERSPPGWYADPEGYFEARWYDGTSFTTIVRNAGASIVAPAAPPAIVGPVGSIDPRWPLPRRRNVIGPGFAIYLAGMALVAVSLFQPWLGGLWLFELPSGPANGINILRVQACANLLSICLVLALTCLPRQPGKLLGFLAGGLIGLAVCWTPIAHTSASKRSNYLGASALLVQLLWMAIQVADLRSAGAPIKLVGVGPGPLVYAIGYLLMIIGALVGRRSIAEG